MDYRTFRNEMLKDRHPLELNLLGVNDPKRVRDALGTLREYFEIIDGERLDPSKIPVFKEAFWFAYDRGGTNVAQGFMEARLRNP
ncbi:MAG: hypothetical protein HY517_00930 [Candidatus Aenigmarchaeota archaeon]|nr:hypothetical protein [Candidatus Aenigmarchaeota archaeon]